MRARYYIQVYLYMYIVIVLLHIKSIQELPQVSRLTRFTVWCGCRRSWPERITCAQLFPWPLTPAGVIYRYNDWIIYAYMFWSWELAPLAEIMQSRAGHYRADLVARVYVWIQWRHEHQWSIVSWYSSMNCAMGSGRAAYTRTVRVVTHAWSSKSGTLIYCLFNQSRDHGRGPLPYYFTYF